MGSIVGGMMFGVRLGTHKMAELFGLRDEWMEVTLDARERYAQQFRGGERYLRAERRFIPSNDVAGDALGFMVAVPVHGRDHHCLTPKRPMPMSALRKTKAYRRARRAWRRFASWTTEKRGVALPRAELMLVEVEVG